MSILNEINDVIKMAKKEGLNKNNMGKSVEGLAFG
jgi:hypothetical protein